MSSSLLVKLLAFGRRAAFSAAGSQTAVISQRRTLPDTMLSACPTPMLPRPMIPKLGGFHKSRLFARAPILR